MEQEKTFYVLECGVEGCRAEFWLNDVPVTLRTPKGGTYFGGPVNHLVVDGMNEVSILVEPGIAPSKALSNGGRRERRNLKKAGAFAKLSRYPEGAVVGGPDGQVLVEARWQSPGETRVYPVVVTEKGDAGDPFGRWAWQDAEPVTLDKAAFEEMGKVIENLRASLEKGDPGPFVKLGATRIEEIERAFGLKPGEKASLIIRGTVKDASQSWWGMQALDLSSIEWRLCGTNRLVDVMSADWKPGLREKKDLKGGVGYYDLKLAKAGGEWKILR